jgi:hypothetical protein
MKLIGRFILMESWFGGLHSMPQIKDKNSIRNYFCPHWHTTFNTSAIGLLLTIYISCYLLGCGSQPVPEEKLSMAKNSYEEARAEDAETFAPESFLKGEKALQSAEAEIASQKDKSLLPPRYDLAERLLETAVNEFKNSIFEANKGLVFTGMLLDRDGEPYADVKLHWAIVEFKNGTLVEDMLFKLVDTENGSTTLQSTNPKTMTDSKGRFLLKIHPKIHSRFLDPKKKYSIRFYKWHGYYTEKGFIQLEDGPFLWSLDSEVGKTLQVKGDVRIDLGTIGIR